MSSRQLKLATCIQVHICRHLPVSIGICRIKPLEHNLSTGYYRIGISSEIIKDNVAVDIGQQDVSRTKGASDDASPRITSISG